MPRHRIVCFLDNMINVKNSAALFCCFEMCVYSHDTTHGLPLVFMAVDQAHGRYISTAAPRQARLRRGNDQNDLGAFLLRVTKHSYNCINTEYKVNTEHIIIVIPIASP